MAHNFRSTQFRIDAFESASGDRVKVKGRLTKAGVFEYLSGTDKIRELRPNAEVFSADSLATLEGAYVTVDHPTASAKDVAVGRVLRVESDPPYVKGVLQVEDSRAARLIENGHLKELSCGYSMKLKMSDTDEADYVQTQIRYDHAALLPEGRGRLGSDVCLRLDSKGNQVWNPPLSNLRRRLGLPELDDRSLRARILSK